MKYDTQTIDHVIERLIAHRTDTRVVKTRLSGKRNQGQKGKEVDRVRLKHGINQAIAKGTIQTEKDLTRFINLWLERVEGDRKVIERINAKGRLSGTIPPKFQTKKNMPSRRPGA